MPQGPNYNLISPFTTFASVSVASTVTGAQYVAAANGNTTAPAFTYANATTSGPYYDGTNLVLAFSVNGNTAGWFNQNGQLVLPQTSVASASTVSGISFGTPGNVNTPILFKNGNGVLQAGLGDFSNNATFQAQAFRVTNVPGSPQYTYTNATSNGTRVTGTTTELWVGSALFSVGTVGATLVTSLSVASTLFVGSGNAAVGFAPTGVSGVAGIGSGASTVPGQGYLLSNFYIVPKTSSYTPSTTESGSTFTNAGAAGTVVFTLPAGAQSGCNFAFQQVGQKQIAITAASGSIFGPPNLTGATRSIASTNAALYSLLEVVTDGTNWYCTNIQGTVT